MYLTRAHLDHAINDILAAPKTGAAISMLCLRPDIGERLLVDEMSVTKAQGIPGERWATRPWVTLTDGRPHPGIQISILPKKVLDCVWVDRTHQIHPGDTFVADMDMSEQNLPVGQLLSVGTAVLRVSDVFNDGCVKWKKRYGDAAFHWVRDPQNKPHRLRGILCSVEKDGKFRTGDLLNKL
ncbi:hypothetical protein BVC71_05550 [Marivivens niveibacter]|uniref:MOSC domain-containing protein n=1 Tax=Marivivens niveibacter TaxID=1930667 RepID=A0A251X2X7_9RHOB|nr:hypothetical protein [Marivivens niveibacter]OUD10931.1 hypothetical protein BVC71_05550 [Marivivens niveibacter]